MFKRDIDSLLNRGKNYVCQYITAHCYDLGPEKSSEETFPAQSNLVERHLSNHDHRRVLQIVDYLLDHRNRSNYSVELIIEWLKFLLAGRRLPNNFANEVKKYDTTSKCCLVWTNNFVAYRCRTCAISLCMSLCANCFLNGDHEGHDFNMFRSLAGGACDCGDSFVMKPEGFCRDHQQKLEDDCNIQKVLPPNSLTCIPQEMISRLLYYLVLSLRSGNFEEDEFAKSMLSDVLIYLNDMGSLMQNILCQALIDPNLYSTSLNTITRKDDLEYQHYLTNLADRYRKAVEEIQLTSILPNYKNTEPISDLEIVNSIESFQPNLVHTSFLDEIIFWTVMNEFPSDLITFLLKILPNEEYKIKFAESFVKHYFRIAMLILYPTKRFSDNSERDIYNNKLANSVVHVSVQLFSNKKLATLLCEESKLLYVIIVALQFSFKFILKPNEYIQNQTELTASEGEAKDKWGGVHQVVQCSHEILRFHRYWPIVSDLNNLFSHKEIAFIFLRDEKLIDLWLEFVMGFQTMNMNVRQTIISDENYEYKAAFLAEFEICQMWSILIHLKDETTAELTINFAKRALYWLEKWFDFISLEASTVRSQKCSFHLPLHRNYSVFVQHAVFVQNVPIEELLPVGDVERMKRLIAHPLQTLSAYHHIMAGLWVHNGLSIKTQALNYTQAHFCNSTIDADIFLIQQVATHIDPDIFMDYFASVYELKRHLCLIPISNGDIEVDKLTLMLENGFTFLATIIAHRICLGMKDSARREMVTLLSTSDKAHSQVHDQLPYKTGLMSNSMFINILHDIAEYKSPEVAEVSGNLTQGYFYPKNQTWEKEYCSLMVLTRNAFRKDFQTSLQRFAGFARQTGKYSSNSLPWPPFRIPEITEDKLLVNPSVILNSRILHAFFFVLLQNGLNDSPNVTQHLLSIVVYLMEMALIETSKRKDLPPLCIDNVPSGGIINEMDFNTWYPNEPPDFMSNFLVNFTKIQSLNISETPDGKDKSVKTKFMVKFFNTLIRDGMLTEDDSDEYRGSAFIIEDSDSDTEDDVIDVEGPVDFSREEPIGSSSGSSSERRVSLNCLEISMLPPGDSGSSNGQRSTAPQLETRKTANDPAITSGKKSEQLRRQNVPQMEQSQVDTDDEDEEEEIDQEEIENARAALIAAIENDNPDTLEEGGSGERSTLRLNKILEMNKCLMKRLVGSDRSSPWSTDDLEVEVDQSILSLLLTLHAKLSDNKQDTFKTDLISLSQYDLDCRIGDGPYFIGSLLKRFILLSAQRIAAEKSLSEEECMAQVIAVVDNTRRKIWPLVTTYSIYEPSTSKANELTSNSSLKVCNSEPDRASPMLVDAPETNDIVMEEQIEMSDRKRKASERKQQILNRFKNMQKQFMENNSDHLEDMKAHKSCPSTTEESMDTSGSDTEKSLSSSDLMKHQPQTYQCVICRDSGFSTTNRAFVQIVLLQSTSIIGNTLTHTIAEEMSSEAHLNYDTQTQFSKVPMNDDQKTQFLQRKTFALNFEQKVDTSSAMFSLDSWLGSFNIGWCGGVHAQSCGHFMHIDCYQSFIESLYRDREGPVDLFDYNCPCCRKSANSMLPIIPNFANLYALVKSRKHVPNEVALEVLELLRNGDQDRLANSTLEEKAFLKRLGKAIEDVMKVTDPQFRNIRVDPCEQSLFLFLSSIVRTNLEYLVILWRNHLISSNQNLSCFVPFFQALSVNAKLVLPMHCPQLWAQIAGIDTHMDSKMMAYEKNVPLILKDVSALLLQFLCALPFNIDRAYIMTLFQSLLDLNFIQALVMVAFYLPEEKRINLKTRHWQMNRGKPLKTYTSCSDYLGLIISNYELSIFGINNSLYVEKGKKLTEETIEKLCIKLCLPFLRIAAMLYNQLFKGEDLPYNNTGGERFSPGSELEEWSSLAKYVGICQQPDDERSLRFIDSIHWASLEPDTLICNWLTEFDKFCANNLMTAQNLLAKNFLIVEKPSLLQLPSKYENLFLYYTNSTCANCCNSPKKSPKELCLCLICGKLICLRENCCRVGNLFEGVGHSKSCGAGTAIYIAINSSTIIVIRGRKACIWGSVYLDEFGETDIDLKRGKPLFLSKDRYRVLEQQWLTHSFPYANKKWIYHKDAL